MPHDDRLSRLIAALDTGARERIEGAIADEIRPKPADEPPAPVVPRASKGGTILAAIGGDVLSVEKPAPTRPGIKTTEFWLALGLSVVATVLNAYGAQELGGVVSEAANNATQLGTAGVVAYIISRGLAAYRGAK